MPEEGAGARRRPGPALAARAHRRAVGAAAGAAGELARVRSLVPVLNDPGQIAAWRQAAPGRPAILHLDTGMARLGVTARDVRLLAAEPERLSDLPLAGVMSHLACADDPASPVNAAQRERFLALSAALRRRRVRLRQAAALSSGPASISTWCGRGAALYGLNPSPGRPNPMRQVVAIKARILQVQEIDQGWTVGYGASYVADRPRRVATLAAGYADGILRMAGNRARCHIGPHPAPVIGRISMDFITVDASDVAAGGDPARRLRRSGRTALRCRRAGAGDCGTLGYEVLDAPRTATASPLPAGYEGCRNLILLEPSRPDRPGHARLPGRGRPADPVRRRHAVAHSPPPFYGMGLLRQMVNVGYDSLPVVGLTSVFTGMVLALQSYTASRASPPKAPWRASWRCR